jgi:hypothetical protein
MESFSTPEEGAERRGEERKSCKACPSPSLSSRKNN